MEDDTGQRMIKRLFLDDDVGRREKVDPQSKCCMDMSQSRAMFCGNLQEKCRPRE